MPISFLSTALLGVSILTNLTVEGVKKLLDKKDAKYSSNMLAAIFSVIIAAVGSGVYLVMTDTCFTTKIGVEIAVLMYLSFLTATVGYDKVMQMWNQLKAK